MSTTPPPEIPFFVDRSAPLPSLAPPQPAAPAATASPTPTPTIAGPPADGGRGARRLLAAALVVVLVAVVGGTTWALLHRHHRQPVVLPSMLAGRAPVQGEDFASGTGASSWRESVRDQMGGNAYDGRAYGTYRAATGGLVNLVVARTDLHGKLDLALAVAPLSRHGAVSCTQTFDVGKVLRERLGDDADDLGDLASQPPTYRPDAVLCWRASRHLTVSAYALLVTPDDEPGLAAAVDEVWAQQ